SDELRRFDRSRKGKKVANVEWKAKADDDARIMKMKDGRTRFGYKAEHVVDLESEVVMSATVREGTQPDSQTLVKAVEEARAAIDTVGLDITIEDVAADKGYHSYDQLVACEQAGIRSYIPEPKFHRKRRWADKSPDVKSAFYNNRKRTKRSKSKQLQRERSEKVERSFAHMCETGGSRRTWLRGVENINKRYKLTAAAHNLGRIMLKLFGAGKPRQYRSVSGRASAAQAPYTRFTTLWQLFRTITRTFKIETHPSNRIRWAAIQKLLTSKTLNFSTAC
ncbi:transposase, partial [bacterium]|nr:transposase [bacterium]